MAGDRRAALPQTGLLECALGVIEQVAEGERLAVPLEDPPDQRNQERGPLRVPTSETTVSRNRSSDTPALQYGSSKREPKKSTCHSAMRRRFSPRTRADRIS